MKRLDQGYHDAVPMADYIADPCPEPSLSTGVVFDLVKRSPLHAQYNHPRFGGAHDESTPRADIGSAVHSLAVGGAPVEYVTSVVRKTGPEKGKAFEPTDWMTSDAKDQREAIREAGGIPLLGCDRVSVETIVASAREGLAEFGALRFEQTMIWRDEKHGVWCRGRPDAISECGGYDLDLKTVENADPKAWADRVMGGAGYDVQMTLRGRGHEQLGGRTRDLVFLLVEISPPYGWSFVGVGQTRRDLANRKIELAMQKWKQCLATKRFPSYPKTIHWAEAPSYEVYDFEQREILSGVT